MRVVKAHSGEIVFRTDEQRFAGRSAMEVVRSMESTELNYPHRGDSIGRFINWSLARLVDRIPPREMGISDRLDEEALALHYLCLRDEYGAGKLSMGKPGTGENDT